MSIKRINTMIAEAPALALFYGNPEERAQQGTILLYHSFNLSKEGNLLELIKLADVGFLAIGIDIIGHGERRFPDFDQRLTIHNMQDFLTVVRATAQEIPAITDALIERGWIYRQRLGIVGTSLGGFIAYAAPVIDKRIQVVASLLGSPEWENSLSESPHLHPDSFFPVAMLSQIALEDAVVPPGPAKMLHRQLLTYYSSCPERLCCIEYPHTGHDLSSETWEQAWFNIIKWFESFLAYTLT